jgi:hypothetical protein
MSVTDSRFFERARQTVAIELRIMPRARNTPNID